MRLLHALGFEIETYHLNEGHAALLTLELLRRHRLTPAMVRPGDRVYDTREGARALRVHHAHAGRGGARPVSV